MTRKLTDQQRVILAAAAARPQGRALPIPDSLRLNPASQSNVLRGMLRQGLMAERVASDDEPVWRRDEDGGGFALVITPEGLAAIGITPDNDDTGLGGAADLGLAATGPGESSLPAPAPEGGSSLTKPMPKPESKLGVLIGLLGRTEGATITELAQATGWQSHSVRGAMSGALKKKLSLSITSETVPERGRVYRIATQEAVSGEGGQA